MVAPPIALLEMAPTYHWREVLANVPEVDIVVRGEGEETDRGLRHAMRWYSQMGKRVWPYEIRNFLFRDRRMTSGPLLAEYWGAPQDAEEESMRPRAVLVPAAPRGSEARVPRYSAG